MPVSILFTTVSPLPGKGKALNKYLLNEYEVATVPGTQSLHNTQGEKTTM